MEPKKLDESDRSSLQILGRRIAAEIGLEPMPTERDPKTGRFDPPGFYNVVQRSDRRGFWRQWWLGLRDLKKP